VAHLVSLGGEKYLDVSPTQFEGTAQQYLFRTDGSKKGSMFRPALERISDGVYLEVRGPIPGKGNSQELQLKLRSAHWIFKVYLNEKTLSLSYLDQQWVEEAIKKKLLQAEHLKARSENSAEWLLFRLNCGAAAVCRAARGCPGSIQRRDGHEQNRIEFASA
jgi:hypothetical protein